VSLSVRTITDLSHHEQRALSHLRQEIARRLPGLPFRMTVFGSRARGDAEADSDMDVLLEVETDHLAFADKQRLRQIASEISLASAIILSLLVVDRQTRHERSDFSLFDSIREEGIPV
jgi:predicted nucleotidyltransferase